MENDLQFICPRPRNARACDSCRSRKSRCLPDKKSSGREICRRCAKLGYPCTFTAASQPNTQERNRQPPKRQPLDDDDDDDDDDIISTLFRDDPAMQKDELSQIYEIHRRVFQGQWAEDDLLDRHNNAKPIHTAAPDSESGDFKIGMQEADKYLFLFRSRTVYFPFVQAPEGASGACMAVHHPFLLLAILAVCSSQMTSLQRRTDERFRRVLSERIIVNGEKSLDYVQGLLVYVAWCPIHLRPLNSQLFQFLQICINMVSDLKLSQKTHDMAAQNACLGCYNLSSILAIGLQRASDNAAESYCKSALSSNIISDLQDETGVQYSKLQMLLDQIARYKPSHIPQENFGRRSETVLETTKLFNSKLQDLDSAISPSADAKIPLHLFRLFIKVQIAFLPLKDLLRSDLNNPPSSILPPTPASPDTDTIESATTCFTEIQAFLEYFLSAPLDQYLNFSTREWCLLIMTIAITPRLCFSPDVSSHSQGQATAKMLIYLESLTHRMGALSASSIGSHLDFFHMFRSVLEIMLPAYTPPNKTTQYRASGDGPAQQGNDKGPALTAGASRCPVMNGSLQQTDFWQTLEQSDSFGEQHMEDMTDLEHVNTDAALLGDGLLGDSQEWSRIFSEWVNDFGMTE